MALFHLSQSQALLAAQFFLLPAALLDPVVQLLLPALGFLQLSLNQRLLLPQFLRLPDDFFLLAPYLLVAGKGLVLLIFHFFQLHTGCVLLNIFFLKFF